MDILPLLHTLEGPRVRKGSNHHGHVLFSGCNLHGTPHKSAEMHQMSEVASFYERTLRAQIEHRTPILKARYDFQIDVDQLPTLKIGRKQWTVETWSTLTIAV